MQRRLKPSIEELRKLVFNKDFEPVYIEQEKEERELKFLLEEEQKNLTNKKKLKKIAGKIKASKQRIQAIAELFGQVGNEEAAKRGSNPQKDDTLFVAPGTKNYRTTYLLYNRAQAAVKKNVIENINKIFAEDRNALAAGSKTVARKIIEKDQELIREYGDHPPSIYKEETYIALLSQAQKILGYEDPGGSLRQKSLPPAKSKKKKTKSKKEIDVSLTAMPGELDRLKAVEKEKNKALDRARAAEEAAAENEMALEIVRREVATAREEANKQKRIADAAETAELEAHEQALAAAEKSAQIQQQIEILRRQLQETRAALAGLAAKDEDITSLTVAHDQARKEGELLREQIADLQTRLGDQSNVEGEIDRLREEHDATRAELKAAEALVDAGVRREEASRDELENLRKAVSNAESEKAKAAEIGERATARATEIAAENAQLNQQVEDLQKRFEETQPKLVAELVAQDERIAALTKQRDEAAAAGTDLKPLRDEVDNLHQALAAAREENARLLKEVKVHPKLAQQLEDLQRNNDEQFEALKKSNELNKKYLQLTQLEAEKAQLHKTIESMKEENAELKTKNAEHRAASAGLDEENAKLKSENVQLHAAHRALNERDEQRHAAFEAAMARDRAAHEAQGEENARLQDENARLRAELERQAHPKAEAARAAFQSSSVANNSLWPPRASSSDRKVAETDFISGTLPARGLSRREVPAGDRPPPETRYYQLTRLGKENGITLEYIRDLFSKYVQEHEATTQHLIYKNDIPEAEYNFEVMKLRTKRDLMENFLNEKINRNPELRGCVELIKNENEKRRYATIMQRPPSAGSEPHPRRIQDIPLLTRSRRSRT